MKIFDFFHPWLLVSGVEAILVKRKFHSIELSKHPITTHGFDPFQINLKKMDIRIGKKNNNNKIS